MLTLRPPAEVFRRPVIVPLRAVAEVIAHARLAEGLGIVPLGGSQEAAEGLLGVLLHPGALVIAQAQKVPGPGIAPLRRLAEQPDGLPVVLVHPLPW